MELQNKKQLMPPQPRHKLIWDRFQPADTNKETAKRARSGTIAEYKNELAFVIWFISKTMLDATRLQKQG